MWAERLERSRKLFLRGSRKRLWRRCLLQVMLWQFCPQGLAKAKTEDNSWPLNSEGNREGMFVEGRRQTLLYCCKWGRGKHFVLRKIRKTAANKSIIARNRTRRSEEPWNKKESKSTNHKITNRDLLNSLKRTSNCRWVEVIKVGGIRKIIVLWQEVFLFLAAYAARDGFAAKTLSTTAQYCQLRRLLENNPLIHLFM